MLSSRFRWGAAAGASLVLAGCAASTSRPEASPVPAASSGTTEVDAVAANPGQYTVLLDNEYVRVIRYELKPGERDKVHTHPAKLSYVLTSGDLQIVPEAGNAFAAKETAGDASWRDAVGRHYAENTGSTPVAILLVEVKAAAKNSARP